MIKTDNQSRNKVIASFTARYDRVEDRISFDCALLGGGTIQLYITHRLGRKIVSALISQIQARQSGELENEFSQRAAVSSKAKSDAVKLEVTNSSVWLVSSMKVQTLGDEVIRLVFQNSDNDSVHIQGRDALIRNVVDVLYKAFVLAEWDETVFPNWVLSRDALRDRQQLN